MIRYIIAFMPFAVFVVGSLMVLIPQAIQNHKQNKECEGLPRWVSSSSCECGFPMWPPLRYITDFHNPFCRLKLAREIITCPKCQTVKEIAVEIE